MKVLDLALPLVLSVFTAGCPSYAPATDRFPCNVDSDCPAPQPQCCAGSDGGLCGQSCGLATATAATGFSNSNATGPGGLSSNGSSGGGSSAASSGGAGPTSGPGGSTGRTSGGVTSGRTASANTGTGSSAATTTSGTGSTGGVCGTVQSGCSSNACCPGLVCGTPFAVSTCCEPFGSLCTSAGDCCTDRCTAGGTCQCGVTADPCVANSDCCPGPTQGGACVCPSNGCGGGGASGTCCSRTGVACLSPSDCCTNNCSFGNCQCGSLQSACHDASDCCGASSSPTLTGCGSALGSFCCSHATGPCAVSADCCQGHCEGDAGVCLG